eukprot:1586805-Heterocapsa_arctica.AAC.1
MLLLATAALAALHNGRGGPRSPSSIPPEDADEDVLHAAGSWGVAWHAAVGCHHGFKPVVDRAGHRGARGGSRGA